VRTYTINKGVNRPVEFKGLKGKYIWWLGGGLVALLGLLAVLYIVRISPVVCIGLTGTSGMILFFQVYRMNRIYGEYGLMKAIAFRRTPRRVKSVSRRLFYGVKEK